MNPERSVLHAQVRRAKASHCVDDSGNYLRPSTFKGPSSKVYLGDVAETLIRCSAGAETPVFTQLPGFDEQRWILNYTAGSLRISIQSMPYWGFGLLTSGYRNEVVIQGPVEERARLVPTGLHPCNTILGSSLIDVLLRRHCKPYKPLSRQMKAIGEPIKHEHGASSTSPLHH